MNKKRRVLVTGAAGMVGSYVPSIFKSDELILTDIQTGYEPLDITDKAQVEAIVSSVRPDIILHLAAATDVDRCEREPAYADKLNRVATEHLVKACPATTVFVY